MRHFIAVLASAMALFATPQLRLTTTTVGPLNIAVGANGVTQTVSTSNIGDGTLTLSASANVAWIAASIMGANVQIALNTSTLAQGIATGALLHPVIVVPLVVEIPDDRGGARRFLVQQAERVGLVDAVSMAIRFDVEFIEGALGYAGDEAFPDAR